MARQNRRVRRNPHSLAEAVELLDALDFFNFYKNRSAGAVFKAAERIVRLAKIARGDIKLDTIERTDEVAFTESGFNVNVSAEGITLLYDGIVSMNFAGTGTLSRGILKVPDWVAYGEDVYEGGKPKSPHLVGLPVNRLSWDLRLSDYGVVVAKTYSREQIERVAGSVDNFLDILFN